MKTAFSTGPLGAALLLHAALVAVVLSGLSIRNDKAVEKPPVTVQLLPPAMRSPPAALPVEAASAAPPLPPSPPSPPAPQAQQPPEPKRVVKPRQRPLAPREAPARRAKAPETPPEKTVAQPEASAAPTPEPVVPPSASASPTASATSGGVTTPPAAPAPPAPPVKTGVSIPASYAASNPKPDYPALSRRYEEQGTVVLQVQVKADGTAGEVKLMSSSGHSLLDKAAMNAVRAWRFVPATSDGKPVTEWYQVPIPFKLRD